MPLVAIEPLQTIFRSQHEFVHAAQLNLTGVDDVELYPRVRAAGVVALISKDGRQLKNQVERRGLHDNGLSFIHLRENSAKGAKGIALDLAALTAGLPYVDDVFDGSEPTAFRLKGLQSGFTERVASHMPLWLASWDSPE